MEATARPATESDVPVLVDLYHELEREMTSLSEMWSLTSGLPAPTDEAIAEAVAASGRDRDVHVVVGSFEGVVLGFMLATVDELLPQGDGKRLGSIRLVFVDPEARAVGVGEAMRDEMLSRLRLEGITSFDAHVLPGHRLAKNFFESGGFAARHIVMHHEDDDVAHPVNPQS